jgi:SulP family sulfate permease
MAGARTRWSGAFTGLVVLATLPLAFLFEPLPRAVLGAIVAVVVFKLIRVAAIVRLWAISPLQMLIAAGTLIATLATAPRIERGVLIGVALSVATHLYREMDLSLVALGDGTRVVIAPRGVLWFGTAHKLEGIVVNAIAAHDDVETLEIDLTGIGRLDFTGAEELRSLCADIETGGVMVSIVGVPAHARRIAGKTLTRWWREPAPSD